MPKDSPALASLPPATTQALRQLGENLAIARIRRKEPQRAWAKRLGVSVPTLIACARREPYNVFDQSRLLASLIPGSRLLPLDSGNHLLPERDPAWPHFLSELDAFLGVNEPEPA